MTKLLLKPLLEGDTAPELHFDHQNLQSRQLIDLLDHHKAILIRQVVAPDGEAGPGAAPAATAHGLTTEDFGQLVMDMQFEYYPYIGGAAPRTIIPVQAGKDIVFTANESPPDQPIPFHHELAQTPKPPEYIFFYCHTPAPQGNGGETPIIDSTLVYRFVQDHYPEFLQKLITYGVRYIRTLPPQDDPTSPIGRSYQNSYNVSSREELEEQFKNIEGRQWEWQTDGSVRVTTEPLPAIRLITDHVQNLVFQYAFANSIIAAFLGWQDSRNNRHEALRFGNMEPMDETILNAIAQYMESHRILHPWEAGDIMALNNSLCMHSRNPFTGKRVVHASIWGSPLPHIIQAQPKNGIAIGTRSSSYFESIQPADPLIFGFWKVPKDICSEVCYNAIKAGYRRLDCASDYGNEIQVGIGIQKAITDGICGRQDLFITSKLWNTYHHPDHVPIALNKTLQDLQLDYIDEYLIHFPISLEYVPIEIKYPAEWTNTSGEMVVIPCNIMDTWKAMEQLVHQGQIKTIGVCNFNVQLLRQLLSTCTIRPSTLQIELHPYNSQNNLIRFAHDAGIRVTAFSIMGGTSYIELNMATPEESLLLHPTIVQIAKHYQKTSAQILIRWAIQRNTFPLCKTIQYERMIENRKVYDFYLTGNEMKSMNALNKNHRYNDPGQFCEPGMGTFYPLYD